MRLIKDEGHGDLSLVEQHGENIPYYAILSHTWGADSEEITFKDLIEGTGKNNAGYIKIEFCRNQAANNGLQFFWVDTCCTIQHLLHYTVPPSVTMPYKNDGICRRKRRESSPSFKY
jgi:hypothetical protein